MSTDTDIILRSRGTPDCFAELYDRHSTAIYRFASARVGPHVAEDIMSETFLVAFDHRSDFDPGIGDVRPWLFGIAVTLLKAHRRIEARNWGALNEAGIPGYHPESLGGTIERSEEQTDAHREVLLLSRALRRMKQGDRDTLLLYALADLSYDETAQALGIPVGTVRSRLHRSRRFLSAAHSSPTPSDPKEPTNEQLHRAGRTA